MDEYTSDATIDSPTSSLFGYVEYPDGVRLPLDVEGIEITGEIVGPFIIKGP